MTFLASGGAARLHRPASLVGDRPVPRAFSPTILQLAAAMSRPPEEVDATVYRVRSLAWAERRAFVGEAARRRSSRPW